MKQLFARLRTHNHSLFCVVRCLQYIYLHTAICKYMLSPLQALMADQVADLEEAGFFSTYINGTRKHLYHYLDLEDE